jgi:hypothetical protein
MVFRSGLLPMVVTRIIKTAEPDRIGRALCGLQARLRMYQPRLRCWLGVPRLESSLVVLNVHKAKPQGKLTVGTEMRLATSHRRHNPRDQLMRIDDCLWSGEDAAVLSHQAVI